MAAGSHASSPTPLHSGDGTGRRQLLQQHQLITMPAASPSDAWGSPSLPFRLPDGTPAQRPRTTYRPFSRFFALAVWAGALTTVIRPQPCGLVSLRMGITQYGEVPTYAWSIEWRRRRAQIIAVVEFSAVAAPRQPQNQTNPTRPSRRSRAQKTTRVRTPTTSSNEVDGPSYGHRAVSRAETRKQPN